MKDTFSSIDSKINMFLVPEIIDVFIIGVYWLNANVFKLKFQELDAQVQGAKPRVWQDAYQVSTGDVLEMHKTTQLISSFELAFPALKCLDNLNRKIAEVTILHKQLLSDEIIIYATDWSFLGGVSK